MKEHFIRARQSQSEDMELRNNMEYTGNLHKMRTELNKPVDYYLTLENQEIHINDFLGSELKLEYTGEINCVKCGRKINKSFSQGFCYPCFKTAPETEECVLRPELCLAHEGIARDMEYAEKHCLNDHFVYLSLTSGIKVGVTRYSQVPTRWIDQGAIKAIKLAKTPNRYTAGLIEVALKEHMADKTNWRNMLTNKITTNHSLSEVKEFVKTKLRLELKHYILDDNSITEIVFPHLEVPSKVASLNFDKTPVIQGILTGIKGQYLIFNNKSVLNIRKFGGYKVTLSL